MLALLGGCSALRFGYGQADALAFRWLDAYVEFDDVQSLQVREALDAWFGWHRRTQLPDYAELLTRLDSAVQTETTPESVCAWWGDVKQRIDVGLDRALPAAAGLAATLKPAQLRNIERRYAKSNHEFRDDVVQADPAKRRREAVKQAVGRAESLYGDIDAAQRERIAKGIAESPFDPQLALDERLLRQQDGLELMRQISAGSSDADRAGTEIRAYLRRVERSPRAAYQRYAERLVQHNCRLAAEVHNSTTAAQRQVAAKRLKGWVADLRALAGDAG